MKEERKEEIRGKKETLCWRESVSCRCVRAVLFFFLALLRREEEEEKKIIPDWILFVYFLGATIGGKGEEEKKRVEEKGTKYISARCRVFALRVIP